MQLCSISSQMLAKTGITSVFVLFASSPLLPDILCFLYDKHSATSAISGVMVFMASTEARYRESITYLPQHYCLFLRSKNHRKHLYGCRTYKYCNITNICFWKFTSLLPYTSGNKKDYICYKNYIRLMIFKSPCALIPSISKLFYFFYTGTVVI